MTIQAPPSRASADKRSSEKAGMNSAFCLSRARLMAVPSINGFAEGYNINIHGSQNQGEDIPLNLNLEKWIGRSIFLTSRHWRWRLIAINFRA
jgi:hypothetical protein